MKKVKRETVPTDPSHRLVCEYGRSEAVRNRACQQECAKAYYEANIAVDNCVIVPTNGVDELFVWPNPSEAISSAMIETV